MKRIRGRKRRQRVVRPRGINRHNAVLTEEQVLDIYSAKLTRYEYRDKYKVAYSTVTRIQVGQMWTHLTGAAS